MRCGRHRSLGKCLHASSWQTETPVYGTEGLTHGLLLGQTSGTFQALHSYMPEDIEWNAAFVPCITSTKKLDATYVDLEQFHATKSTLFNDENDDDDEDDVFKEIASPEVAFSSLKRESVYGTIPEQV